MRRREFTLEEQQDIYKMYYQDKIGITKIGKKYNVSRTVICRLFEENGWTIRTPEEANDARRYKFTKEEIQDMYDCYHKQGLSLESIGDKYGVNIGVIVRIFNENNFEYNHGFSNSGVKAHQFTDKEENDIYDKYFHEKASLDTIAEIYHVSRSVILTLFRKKGWKTRTIAEANSTYLPDEIIESIVYEYTVNKKGTYVLQNKYGISQDLIEKTLKRHGVVLRNYTEAKQEGRKYSVNDNFFKTQSSDMAYVLGLMASDGNVSQKENAMHIALQASDIDILEKIREVMQSTRPIKIYSRKNLNENYQDTAKLSIWSAEIKKDLAIYGIVPNKTFILKPPTHLNPKYYIDYIRGYFDGDGCVVKTGYSLTFDIGGASKSVIEWIREVIVNQYGIPNNGIYTKAVNDGAFAYHVTLYGEKAQRFFEIMYKDANLYLERKFKTYTLLTNPRGSNSSVEE